MRKLKFRIAYEIHGQKSLIMPNKLSSKDNFMLSLGGIVYENYGVKGKDFWENVFDADIFAIQQFTGLKDINGKEIYEGDILRVKEYDDEEGFTKICEVKFGNAIFDGGFYAYIGFFLEDKHGYTLEPSEITSLTKCDGRYSFEVIGNIHENIDLLK